MEKEIINCVCMVCGIRNDHSHEDGLCQNGHDDWLEYYDVVHENEFFDFACKKFNIPPQQMKKKFMDNTVLQF